MVGRTLSHYKVLEEISRGGMGIVYKALDLKLNREVAVKVLPPELVAVPDRKRRFVQEAQAAAALKHPNIAHVYEIGEAAGATFIVMELVEGEKLSNVLAEKALPASRALAVAIEIAKGLARAHEKGIVHRDLKPANILITPEGHPKIIDFGLAKLVEPAREVSSEDETTVRGETDPGTVMGTFFYMSPEQARGQTVDPRSDVFSFGVLLYEMLTGSLPFRGATGAETLGAILKDPTPRLPAAAGSRSVQAPLDKCLAKSPEDRFATAKELLEALERARVSRPKSKPVASVAAASVSFAVLAGGLYLAFRSGDEAAVNSFRLANPVQVTTAQGVEEDPSWSPDGSMLAFSAGKAGVRGALETLRSHADVDIWIVQLGGGAPINRTADHTGFDRFPAWSPDGLRIAFWSRREGGGYFIIPALAGPARKIRAADIDDAAGGTAWSADGKELACVVYEENDEPFVEIVNLATDRSRLLPLPGDKIRRFQLSWSPDERFFAYVDGGALNEDVNQLWVSDTRNGEAHRLTDGTRAAWSPTWSPDSRTVYYVTHRGSSMDLWQQSLTEEGRPNGAPTALTTGVGMRQSIAFSRDHGQLAYSKGRLVANLWRVPILDERAAIWSDAEQLTFESTHIQFFDLSPDEDRILLSSDKSGNFDLWMMPAAGGEMVQLTTDPAQDWAPRWSPDGEQIVFYSYRSGNRDIWVMPLDRGPARQLTRHDALDQSPTWSPDGRHIVFTSTRRGNRDLWMISADGGDPSPLVTSRAYDSWARYSPDGNTIAFLSDRTGEELVWLLPTEGGEPYPLSSTTSRYPDWSADGKIVYFLGANAVIESVSLDDRSERRVADLGGRPGRLGGYGLGVGREHIYFTWDQDIGDIWVMDVLTN